MDVIADGEVVDAGAGDWRRCKRRTCSVCDGVSNWPAAFLLHPRAFKDGVSGSDGGALSNAFAAAVACACCFFLKAAAWNLSKVPLEISLSLSSLASATAGAACWTWLRQCGRLGLGGERAMGRLGLGLRLRLGTGLGRSLGNGLGDVGRGSAWYLGKGVGGLAFAGMGVHA